VYAHSRWHAEGLRWIGSLLLLAADRLERAAIAAAHPEPAPIHDEPVDEVRQRILSRYY
jgi:hypothetical protein